MGSAPCCLLTPLPPHPTWLTSQPTAWKPQSGQPGCSQTPWDTAYQKVERSMCCACDTDSLPPRLWGGCCLWLQQAPGSHPHMGPGAASFLGSWPTLGLCVSPRPLQQGDSSSIHTGGPQHVPTRLGAPGAGCLDDFPGPHRSSCPMVGMRSRDAQKAVGRGRLGVSAPGLQVEAFIPGLGTVRKVWLGAGGWPVGLVWPPPAGKSSVHLPLCLRLRSGGEAGDSCSSEIPQPGPERRRAGASRGVKWCAAVNRSVSECTRVGTCTAPVWGER